VEVATAQASASMAERDAVEKAALLRSLGADNAEGGKTLPANVRTQIRQLEEDQKRRGKRAVVDGLDRAMTDLLSFYRDVLAVQVGSDVDLVNAAQVADVRAVAAASDPQQTLRRTEAIATARTRLAGNVAPLLAVEAMTVALRPQG
jgi:DNA polymerase-3 subunit delta'